jgi:hypothetical protein
LKVGEARASAFAASSPMMDPMNYITAAGPQSGPILWSALVSAVGVYEDGGILPVGVATPVAWDGQGRALFTLLVRGTPVPGRWLVVDRVFIEATVDG